ncbi:MAG TPA: hypothetical protein PLN61_08795 [bacterium]|nr:hypothetical protein [bacterium]HQI48752.1 hypothetical protein [bacterium]HQJ65239.1 hypothetical protein [bacterium]
MSKQQLGLRVASIIFALIALAQLARLVARVEVTAAGLLVPLWPSAVVAALAGALSWWLCRLARTSE